MPLFNRPSSSHPPPAAQSPYPPASQLHSQHHQQQSYGAPPPPQQTQYGAGGYNAGYQQQQQQYPPPGSQGGYGAGGDIQLRAWFDAVDVDRSGQISQIELKQALVNGDWSPFEDATLMNIFDTDMSGTIGFQEFAGLWQYVKEWQQVFRNFDRDRSGTIEGHELANALQTFGYSLSPQLIQILHRKYNPQPPVKSGPLRNNAGPPPGITFDRFVRCCVSVRQLSESFKGLDQDRDGWININYETFMTLARLPSFFLLLVLATLMH
ncbi:hypothetical protein JCM1840_004190 [Sporobolomyces johnsonii]